MLPRSDPPKTGHLRVFPFNTPLPNASVVNFVPGQDIANNTVVPQCINCGSNISIFVATKANVIVDVIGYFEKPTDQPTQVYKVGDPGPAGDWMFYITNAGKHGLEAAPMDHQFEGHWGCLRTAILGADGRGVGTGAQSTVEIMAGCGGQFIAAELADNYSLNGFKDWFLPSTDELNQMYLNIGPGTLNVGGFTNDIYWSSTEAGSDNSWFQTFDKGIQTFGSKVFRHKVRPVRFF